VARNFVSNTRRDNNKKNGSYNIEVANLGMSNYQAKTLSLENVPITIGMLKIPFDTSKVRPRHQD